MIGPERPPHDAANERRKSGPDGARCLGMPVDQRASELGIFERGQRGLRNELHHRYR
jgi:hypothetical protein